MTINKIAIVALVTAGALTSCSGNDFLGQWASSAPVAMQDAVPAASRAVAEYTFDFSQGADSKSSGPVMISATMDLTQPVQGDSMSIDSPYEVSVAATASVSGTWNLASDDDDELVLAFDMSTVNVVVDPHGVTFSQNVLTGLQQPMLDSLTTATAEAWKAQITAAFKNKLSEFAMLDDVEVSDNKNILTFETKQVGHKTKYAFRRELIGD